ncbi:MAG: hypothetical protein LBH85_01750 [Treponema sp.]|nr:hypothetical protein [Treponema sp.]
MDNITIERFGLDEGSGLADIVAVGDGLNHATFTGEKLNRSMSELLRAGFAAGAWRRLRCGVY